ncbi:MAG: hypothetical protein HDS18_04315 [Bacteroides sp.]|nr:hypothetical protein [Bacteroides sp.]
MSESPNSNQESSISTGTIVWIVIVAFSTIAIFFSTLKYSTLNWYESAGLAGSWASIIGIAITLWQVIRVKSTTSQINDAVSASNKVLLNVNSLQDISESYQITLSVQNFIRQSQLECALLRMSDLIKSLENVNNTSKISKEFTNDCNNYCKTMISDIKSLNANLKYKSNIDLDLIVNHLFDLSHFLNKLINELKTSAYAGPTISKID